MNKRIRIIPKVTFVTLSVSMFLLEMHRELFDHVVPSEMKSQQGASRTDQTE